MPIPKSNLTTPPPVPVVPPVAVSPEYRGVTVDSRYTPLQSLLSHVEGSSWTVHFYTQIVDDDDPLSGQKLNRGGAQQQYRLIKNFELKVSSPLTASQDEQSRAMVVNGTANVYSSLKPNDGDVFLADVGDGKEGVFEIRKSRRMGVLKDAIHEIEYQLVDYATPERLADLKAKTVKVEVFVRSQLDTNQTPFLAEGDYLQRQELKSCVSEVAEVYFSTFLQREYMTLTVPDQNQETYDPFLVDAVLALFTTDQAQDLRYVRQLNCAGDEVMKATTIWDVLLNRTPMLLPRVSRQMGIVRARSFEPRAVLEGIFHSGITYVVYPLEPERSLRSSDLRRQKVTVGSITRPAPINTLDAALDTPVLSGLDNVQGNGGMDMLPTAGSTPYYVFSQAFYENQPNVSRLELQVRAFLAGKAMDPAQLLEMIKTYVGWEAIDQYYYAPVLILLIQAYLRGF